MQGSQKEKKPQETRRDGGRDIWHRDRGWKRDEYTATQGRRDFDPRNTDETRARKVTAALWKKTETWLGIRGCLGALLSKLLSRLLIWSSPSPSLWFPELLTWIICDTSLLSSFFPSACFSLLPNSLTSFSFSTQQDKLSEEVRKQHDGPEENGAPPASQTEPDSENPDASQSEEDKDKTKPLLERLKALEVATFPHLFFSLCSLPYLLCVFIPASSSHPRLSSVAGSVCQLSGAFASVASVSMTAHQILPSLLRLESKVILRERPPGPWAVLQLWFVFLCALGFRLHPPRAARNRSKLIVFVSFCAEATGHTSSWISSAIKALRLN